MTFRSGPGERILWQGQPAQGLRFTAYDIFAIPFALFWLAIPTGGLVALLLSDRPVDPVFLIVMPAFLLIGLYMLAGRFLVDLVTRKRTRYVLTNQRAIIEGGLFRSNHRSINLVAVPELRLRRGRAGRGTIQFGTSGAFGFGIPPGWPGASQFLPPAFDGIEQAEQVYELALRAQQEGRASTS